MNRTAQGLLRRVPLEETINSNDRHVSTDAVEDELDEQSLALMQAGMQFPFMDNSQVYVAKLEGDFVQAYVPSNFTPGANPPGAYVQSVITAMTPAQRGVALDYAVRALWMSRLGRMRGDQTLTVQGEQAYGHALRHLQTALYNPQLAKKDTTLAAASICSLYEVSQLTQMRIALLTDNSYTNPRCEA